MGLCASTQRVDNWRCKCGLVNAVDLNHCKKCKASNPRISQEVLETANDTAKLKQQQQKQQAGNSSVADSNVICVALPQGSDPVDSVHIIEEDTYEEGNKEKGAVVHLDNNNDSDTTNNRATEQKQNTPPRRRISRGSEWELLRGKQNTPELKLFAQLGMHLLSHMTDNILHSTDQPLTVQFTAPPRVDAVATLEYAKTATDWKVIEETPDKGVQVKQRPLAQKILLVIKFPFPGKYKVTMFCKEAYPSLSDQIQHQQKQHQLVCMYNIHVAKATSPPDEAPIDVGSPKTSPKRHKKATSFRATTLSRVDTAASPTGEDLKKNKDIFEQAIPAAEEEHGTTVNEQARKKHGVRRLDFVDNEGGSEEIVHSTEQALTINLFSPPRVECEAVMRLHKDVTGEDDTGKFPIFVWKRVRVKGSVVLTPRPMAHKVKIVVKFPTPGRYEVRVFCRDATRSDESGSLVLRYLIQVEQKTASLQLQKRRNTRSNSNNSTSSNSRVDDPIGSSSSSRAVLSSFGSPSTGTRKSPGMHLSGRKKIKNKHGRRDTSMSKVW